MLTEKGLLLKDERILYGHVLKTLYALLIGINLELIADSLPCCWQIACWDAVITSHRVNLESQWDRYTHASCRVLIIKPYGGILA